MNRPQTHKPSSYPPKSSIPLIPPPSIIPHCGCFPAEYQTISGRRPFHLRRNHKSSPKDDMALHKQTPESGLSNKLNLEILTVRNPDRFIEHFVRRSFCATFRFHHSTVPTHFAEYVSLLSLYVLLVILHESRHDPVRDRMIGDTRVGQENPEKPGHRTFPASSWWLVGLSPVYCP